MVPFRPGKMSAVRTPLRLHVKIRPFDPQPRPVIFFQTQQRDLVMNTVACDIGNIFFIRADHRCRMVHPVIRQRGSMTAVSGTAKDPVAAGTEHRQIPADIKIAAAVSNAAVNRFLRLNSPDRLSVFSAVEHAF